jgi:hypothetical protein
MCGNARRAAGERACVRARGPSSRSGMCMKNDVRQYAMRIMLQLC